MALVQVDTSEVAEAIQPGTYKVRIINGVTGRWSTGTPYVNWRMETFGDDEKRNNGRSIFFKTPTTGKGAFRLADLYRAATKKVLAGNFDSDELIGAEVVVTVIDGKDQEGNPSGYTEVKAVKPL